MTAAVPALSHPHCDGRDVITDACDDQPIGRFRWMTRAGAPTTVRDLCAPCHAVLERLGFPIRRDDSWAGRAVARQLPPSLPVPPVPGFEDAAPGEITEAFGR